MNKSIEDTLKEMLEEGFSMVVLIGYDPNSQLGSVFATANIETREAFDSMLANAVRMVDERREQGFNDFPKDPDNKPESWRG